MKCNKNCRNSYKHSKMKNIFVIWLVSIVSLQFAIGFPSTKEYVFGEYLKNIKGSKVVPGEISVFVDTSKQERGIPCSTVDVEESITSRNGLTDKEKLWKTLRYWVQDTVTSHPEYKGYTDVNSIEGSITSSIIYNDARHNTPEEFEKTLSSLHVDKIHAAAMLLQEIVPCVQFESFKSLPPSPYVQFQDQKNGICSSNIGIENENANYVYLSNSCHGEISAVLHEFIHALGLSHEQNRPDRDSYVAINWKNIQEGKEKNFMKKTEPEWSTYNTIYNWRSIMHYSLNLFSSNGEPTITLGIPAIFVEDQPFFNAIPSFQVSDVQKLRKMYSCCQHPDIIDNVGC